MKSFTQEKIQLGEHELAAYSLGDSDQALVLIHGGPGAASETLQGPHERYAEMGYRVITWDQLGCGNSDEPDDDSLWTIERFTDEVKAVTDHFGLKKIHMMGRSWGGILAIEYTLKYPEHLKTLILGNTSADGEIMQRGFERFKMNLGNQTYQMMSKREANGTKDNPEYKAAITLLMRRHLCRLEEWPVELTNSVSNAGKKAMDLIFGENLFHCTGAIRSYSRLSELHNIKVPTLIMTGEHDYVSIDCAIAMKAKIQQAELHVLKGCSHAPYYEDPEQYHAVLSGFLEQQLDHSATPEVEVPGCV